MEIRIRETGQVVYEAQFREMHPSMSFPAQLTEELLDSLGADVVFEGPQASGTVYQFSRRDGVEEVNGKWFTKYTLGPVFQDTTDKDGNVTTAAEHEAAYKARIDGDAGRAVRADRDRRLAETDWMVIKAYETNANVPAVWELYRQALRDVPSQEGFPHNVQWPAKPEQEQWQ